MKVYIVFVEFTNGKIQILKVYNRENKASDFVKSETERTGNSKEFSYYYDQYEVT